MLKIDDLKEAINQLPIAYYLGKNISVDIDTQSPTSYINIQDLKIYISYNQILNDYNNNNNIINEQNEEVKESYIALVKQVYGIVHKLLDVLAIEEVEKM